MRQSLPPAIVVLVAVAAIFALMAITGIGGDEEATTAPKVTTIILHDTITPTDLRGTPVASTATTARPPATTGSASTTAE